MSERVVFGQLARLVEAKVFADIDRFFALLVADLGGDDAVTMAAAVTSAMHRSGHTCLPLAHGGRPVVELVDVHDAAPEATPLPELEAIRLPADLHDALASSPVVAQSGRDGAREQRPLVLDEDRLYLHRLHRAECDVAEDLSRRGRSPADGTGIDAAADRIFENLGPEELAAARSTAERLCIVTGGPGTGKTTLAARLIAVLVDRRIARPHRIGLATPTGKASARLQESVRGQIGGLARAVPALAEFRAEAQTIHRLLSSRNSRLERLDALVVDECSMVDLPLMARLIRGLPETCRLVLLGDADQLSSVEPGSVFSDLCQAGLGVATGPLRGSVIRLTRNYRFGPDSGIYRLAQAVVRGRPDAALAALADPASPDVELRPLADKAAFDEFAAACAVEWQEHIEQLGTPDVAERAFPARRVLCGHRRGPFGIHRLNRLVERRLRDSGAIERDEAFYVGRPIIVTRNDRSTGLSNGDTGVVLLLPGGDGERRVVWFPDLDRDDERFLVSPSRLPRHESFFALTVHRAQGSEYDEVVFIPGEGVSRLNTRELLYTAVTRARRKVTVMASQAAVRSAVERRTERSTGLFERMRRLMPHHAAPSG